MKNEEIKTANRSDVSDESKEFSTNEVIRIAIVVFCAGIVAGQLLTLAIALIKLGIVLSFFKITS